MPALVSLNLKTSYMVIWNHDSSVFHIAIHRWFQDGHGRQYHCVLNPQVLQLIYLSPRASQAPLRAASRKCKLADKLQTQHGGNHPSIHPSTACTPFITLMCKHSTLRQTPLTACNLSAVRRSRTGSVQEPVHSVGPGEETDGVKSQACSF